VERKTMEMTDTEKLKRLLEQLLDVCDRVSPGPWKYREDVLHRDEYGEFGDVHSLADKEKLRARQTMICENAWLQDAVFCCDARDYYEGALKSLQEILEMDHGGGYVDQYVIKRTILKNFGLLKEKE
jgi:hypothetical protein